jgi:hypothetical protein
MFNRSRALMVAVLGMALSAAHLAAPPAHRTPVVEVAVSKKRKRGLFNGAVYPSSPTLWGSSSLRISAAQSKRNSAKRRNQRRHKRHLKG